jgi:hypothetical protein
MVDIDTEKQDDLAQSFDTLKDDDFAQGVDTVTEKDGGIAPQEDLKGEDVVQSIDTVTENEVVGDQQAAVERRMEVLELELTCQGRQLEDVVRRCEEERIARDEMVMRQCLAEAKEINHRLALTIAAQKKEEHYQTTSMAVAALLCALSIGASHLTKA